MPAATKLPIHDLRQCHSHMMKYRHCESIPTYSLKKSKGYRWVFARVSPRIFHPKVPARDAQEPMLQASQPGIVSCTSTTIGRFADAFF